MSVPSINSNTVNGATLSADDALDAGISAASAGLSTVTDSMSSAETDAEKPAASVVDVVTAPFKAAGEFISNIITSLMDAIASFFNPDHEKVAFIRKNLDSLSSQNNSEVLNDALSKFSHLSGPKSQLEAFKMIQNAKTVDAAEARLFYDLIPVDAQNHLERHIWEANERLDNGQGLGFGRLVIAHDIKGDLVNRALEAHLREVK